MTNDEYFNNIHRIKREIQKLDDDFYDQPIWYEIDTTAYEAARKILVDELEAAFNA